MSSSIVLFAASTVIIAIATLAMAQPLGDLSGTDTGAFSPLNRPYASDINDYSTIVGSSPYITMNSLSGESGSPYDGGIGGHYDSLFVGSPLGQHNSGGSFKYGAQNDVSSPYSNNGLNRQFRVGSPYSGGLNGPYNNALSSFYGFSGSGGCCMPANAANALASSGIGSIYNPLSFAIEANPITTQSVHAAIGSLPPQQPLSAQGGGISSANGFGDQYGNQYGNPYGGALPYGFPSSLNNGNSGYGSSYPPAHYCMPICGGSYSNYGNSDMLNAYGGNAYGNPSTGFSPPDYPRSTLGSGDAPGFISDVPQTSQSTFSGVNSLPYTEGNTDFSNSLFSNNPIGFPRRSSSKNTHVEKKSTDKTASGKA